MSDTQETPGPDGDADPTDDEKHDGSSNDNDIMSDDDLPSGG